MDKTPIQKTSRSRETVDPQDFHHCRPRLNSKNLFGAENEIVIEHNNEDYRLRITSNGKLILTK